MRSSCLLALLWGGASEIELWRGKLCLYMGWAHEWI